MISKEKLEGMMNELALTYEAKGDNIWRVSGEDTGLENVLLLLADPVVVIQVPVMKVPHQGQAELFQELLRLNATDMVHGAYGIQGETIILIDTLEGDGMDAGEFRASLEAMGLALSQHYQVLAKYRN
jgi:hypothetical protein